MSYNLTGIASNISSPLTFIQAVNTGMMSGLLGILLLVSISTILLISFFFTTNDIGKALTATSYIAMVLSILLRALNLVPNIVLYTTVIISAVWIAITWKRS